MDLEQVQKKIAGQPANNHSLGVMAGKIFECICWVFQRLLDNLRIRQLTDCQLADWTTSGLDNSRMQPAILRA